MILMIYQNGCKWWTCALDTMEWDLTVECIKNIICIIEVVLCLHQQVLQLHSFDLIACIAASSPLSSTVATCNCPAASLISVFNTHPTALPLILLKISPTLR